MKKLFLVLLLNAGSYSVFAQSLELPTPTDSEKFGLFVKVLPNGNYVVIDYKWGSWPILNAGAVYLYNGQTNALISTLQGSHQNDFLGSEGIAILTNGNFVVISPDWDNGLTVVDAGAVTYVNSITGINGVVSGANSLIGTGSYDAVGSRGVTAIANGNYLVSSPGWSSSKGAVTFGKSSVGGAKGVVSAANSLVGSNTDRIGSGGFVALPNGNYLVASPQWSNNKGAVTFGNGTAGVSGVVSAANSLVGNTTNDFVGHIGPSNTFNFPVKKITVLPNSNYVVNSPQWQNGTATDAGAVTFGSGTAGISGVVGTANSLAGSNANDQVGLDTVVVLNNSNYLLSSPYWDNGSITNAGAVTFGNGTTGVTGLINAANSLVGSSTDDLVGYNANPSFFSSDFVLGITVLANGNYVVGSPFWDNGTASDAGAATFGSGTTGVKGAISAANSLVGSTANDGVGRNLFNRGIVPLTNGNYLACSNSWDNGAVTNVGAVTFGNGITGTSGLVSATNSLVGSTASDRIGEDGAVALSNGNYVVSSGGWDKGSVVDVGSVTFGNGATGITGVVSTVNSLVGSTAGDKVGADVYIGNAAFSSGTIALTNGNYVVRAPEWDNGSMANAGAVTFGNGTAGITGAVTNANSLVGSKISDQVGGSSTVALLNGNYVVRSPGWSNGSIANAGAVTFGNGAAGITGAVTTANSLVGNTVNSRIGDSSIWALSNGNYLVPTPTWANGSAVDAGAITFGNGTTGVTGVISAANSLVGSTTDDKVGAVNIWRLSNGNYLVYTPTWDNGNTEDAGAITFGNSATGITGVVSTANSLAGSTSNDLYDVSFEALRNGNYVIHSYSWDNGGSVQAGSVTLGNGAAGTSGAIASCNSVLGNIGNSSRGIQYSYNYYHDNLLVGKYVEKKVVVFAPSQSVLATSTTTAGNSAGGMATVAFVNASCNLVASLKPGAPAPVRGNIQASVYIQPTTPILPTGEAYCRRYYRMLPADSADFKTARVTLYFTQADFDDYNNSPGITSKLPQNSTDAAGKTALRITQQKGTSPTGDFGSFTGFTGSGSANVLVIPGDSNVVWNSSLSRWEISLQVTGFGGFFLSAGNDVPLSGPAEIHNVSGIKVSPVPATNLLTITNSKPQIAGSTVTALNLQGQVMATTTLGTSTQMDVQSWPAGMYLLKFADGSVLKMVKQ